MPLSPFAGTMRQLMSAYHDEMVTRVEATVADLQLRWQPVKRALALQIQRLEQQMLAAERAGEPLTLAWLTQARRLAELKAAVEGDVGQFAQTLRQLVGQAQQDAAQLGSTAAQEALAASVPPGMSYTFGVPPRDVLDQLAGAVQPHSPLSTIFENYGAQAAYNAQQALFTSVALGEGAAQAAQRLVWATDMSASRAEVIARTEIMRSWRGAQMANYRANSDVVDQWEWSCDISPRSCGACLGMDGTLHNMDEELDDHVCGRCSALPVTKPWSEILAGTGVPDDQLAALDQMSAARPQRETGSQWFDRQPPEIQAQILGPAKAAAYQAGDLTLSDLVDYSYSPQWGTSLREASMRDLGLDAQKYLRMARSGMARARAITQPLGAGGAATPSPVWQQIADSLSSSVTYDSDMARERLAASLGMSPTDEQVAALAGAPAGSTVTVSKHGEITVTPPDGRYTSSVYVQPGQNGPMLLNWRFEGPDGANTIAVDPEALATQVRQAHALGVDGIHMKARSGSADYAELPQLGYNAPIEQVLTEARSRALPPGLEDAPTLLDVLATPEGRAWWSENGLNPGMDFDPHPGSLSWRILDAYLRAHGLRGLDE